jgi:acyl carrier protein
VTNEEILEKLTIIFRDVLDDDKITLSRATTPEDIKDWDSANNINIVVSIEGRFSVRFNNAEVERLSTIGDFIDLIQSKLSVKR